MTEKFYRKLGSAYLAHFARRLSDLINEQSSALTQRYGLLTPPSSISTLLFVDQNPGKTVAELAVALGVSHQMATQRINSLIKLSLIERQPADYDKRAKVIQLTQQGKQEIAKIEPFIIEMNFIFNDLENEVGHAVSLILMKTEDLLLKSTLIERVNIQEEKHDQSN